MMKTKLGLLRRILLVVALFSGFASCINRSASTTNQSEPKAAVEQAEEADDIDQSEPIVALLVSPASPKAGERFKILAVGGKDIRKAKIEVNCSSGTIKSEKSKNGNGLPFWRIDEFIADAEGNYQVTIKTKKATRSVEFSVAEKPSPSSSNSVWNTLQGWTPETEMLYSAWINALFQEADERSSWTALHEVMQNEDRNFLYNHLLLGEDDPKSKIRVIMEPDCADNPFYLRAYFAWKLGLPFGYHVCDRGYLGRNPGTGKWVTNEINISKSHPIQKFNSFLRMVMDGVHSGTARTSLTNEDSDYYPVPLTREALRPGCVFADPYGHTFILVRWIPQSNDSPGVLLAVDAQPDGTVAIKRFWKGNFLFTTSEVIGEPGFKAFRPIVETDGKLRMLKSDEISALSGMTPFSLQQKAMESDVFYHTMERVINPKPLDPEMAMLDLIKALHEQLTVRVNSVANGEVYMKAHQGEVIPMPGKAAGVFQTGGIWEDFSTPNRDLRLLIAMDAVLDFPNKIVRSPDDYKMPVMQSPEHVKKNIEALLEKKLTELSITYIRTNGTEQILTLREILNRKDAFEMAYNPNDGVEIRWGAPENSEEISTCRRRVSSGQLEKMRSVRVWFQKRLHPPT